MLGGMRLLASLDRLRKGGLRVRILSWIFVPTVIILAAVALVIFYAYQQVTVDLVRVRDQELTRLFASQLGTDIKEYPALLVSLSRMAEFQENDQQVVQAALHEARNRLVVFDGGVVVLDNFGTLLAAAPGRPQAVGSDWSDRAFFHQIASDLQPIFSNVMPDGQGHEMVVAAVPILGDHGEFLGVMAGMFRVGASAVSAFYGEIVKLRIGEGGRTYLIDENGRVIFHNDFTHIGQDFSNQQAAEEALLGLAGSIRTQPKDQVDTLATFAPVPGTPWHLVTEQDWRTLGGESRQYQGFLVALLILGVLVPLAFVAFGVQRITRPLEELIGAAREVASGDFSRSLPAQSGDEIGQLTRQFNRMSARLQESYALLEKRVADRTQELEALYAADEEFFQHLDVSQVLQTLVDVAVNRLRADKSALMVWDDPKEHLIVRASFGFRDETLEQMVFAPGEGVVTQVATSGESAVVEDVETDPQVASRITSPEGIRSFMHFPVKVGEQVFGVLNVSFIKPRSFGVDERRLFSALAQRAALAIENARLYREEQDRRRELQTLLEVAATASSSLDLDELLATTLDRLAGEVGVSRAGVMLPDEQSGELNVRLLRPEREVSPQDLAKMTQACQIVMESGETVVVAPNEDQGLLEPGALLPMRVRGQTLGVLGIIGFERERFSKGQVVLFQSIADQMGVAVENARLYERAEQAAVAAERSRLARELHDAVTQTLFSASLIAEVLPRLWERDPEEGRRRLVEIRELSRGALAEMRTLLLELRPAALADSALGDLLKQLIEAFTSRARIPVSLEIQEQASLPIEAKVAFYRIAQEALNNVAKHAAASNVTIRMRCHAEAASLCVEDNGRGFAHNQPTPDHIGLGIMQERAQAIGASLTIDSDRDRGTRVYINWTRSDLHPNGDDKNV